VTHNKGDLITNRHSSLSRCKNHFPQLLNIHGVCYVRQTDIHTAEPLVHEPRAFEFEIAIAELSRHKSLSNDQMPAEMIKAEGKTIRSEII
jgi:hypothetical protein